MMMSSAPSELWCRYYPELLQSPSVTWLSQSRFTVLFNKYAMVVDLDPLGSQNEEFPVKVSAVFSNPSLPFLCECGVDHLPDLKKLTKFDFRKYFQNNPSTGDCFINSSDVILDTVVGVSRFANDRHVFQKVNNFRQCRVSGSNRLSLLTRDGHLIIHRQLKSRWILEQVLNTKIFEYYSLFDHPDPRFPFRHESEIENNSTDREFLNLLRLRRIMQFGTVVCVTTDCVEVGSSDSEGAGWSQHGANVLDIFFTVQKSGHLLAWAVEWNGLEESVFIFHHFLPFSQKKDAELFDDCHATETCCASVIHSVQLDSTTGVVISGHLNGNILVHVYTSHAPQSSRCTPPRGNVSSLFSLVSIRESVLELGGESKQSFPIRAIDSVYISGGRILQVAVAAGYGIRLYRMKLNYVKDQLMTGLTSDTLPFSWELMPSVSVECPNASLPLLGICCRLDWLVAWSGDCVAKYYILQSTTADQENGVNDTIGDAGVALRLKEDGGILPDFAQANEEIKGLAISANDAFIILATRRRGVGVDPTKKVKLLVKSLDSLEQSVERIEELALFSGSITALSVNAQNSFAGYDFPKATDFLMRLRPNISSIEVQAMIRRLEKYQSNAVVSEQATVMGPSTSSDRECHGLPIPSLSLNKKQLLRLIWSVAASADSNDTTSTEAKIVRRLECVLLLVVAERICRFMLDSLEGKQTGESVIELVNQQPYAEFFGCSLKYLLDLTNCLASEDDSESTSGESGAELRKMVKFVLSAEKLDKLRQIHSRAELPEPLCSFCNTGEKPILPAKPVAATAVNDATGPAETDHSDHLDARYWVCKSGHTFNRCSATLLPICHNSWRRCSICYAFSLSYTESVPYFRVLPVSEWERCNMCGGLMCNN